MTRTIFLITALGLAAACERPAENRAVGDKAATTPAATNTAINERDRDPTLLTPEEQGSSEADRGVTQRVRQGVVKNDTLSVTGKNVKIITNAGVVTLRGPVKTAAEKTQIATIAAQTDGVKRVENQLEIAAN